MRDRGLRALLVAAVGAVLVRFHSWATATSHPRPDAERIANLFHGHIDGLSAPCEPGLEALDKR
jgi:hypothetical protein